MSQLHGIGLDHAHVGGEGAEVEGGVYGTLQETLINSVLVDFGRRILTPWHASIWKPKKRRSIRLAR